MIGSRICIRHRRAITPPRILTLFNENIPSTLSRSLASSMTLTSTTSTTSTSATTQYPTRPFKILGLQQIAIGSLDKSCLSHLWTYILGVPKVGTYKSTNENVDEDILILGKENDNPLSTVEIDLMTPLDDTKSPKVHIPPLNHIGLWVDDLPKAVDWMQSIGVRFTPGSIRKGASGHDVTFIHPKGNENSPIGGEGVLIELVQAPQDVIDASK